MERYNYREAVKNDVREYVEENVDINEWEGNRDGLEAYLNDELWIADSVTGNGSGPYYCNSWKAEEAIAHNWDLLAEAIGEFGDKSALEVLESAEACDVTIRCHILPEAIADYLDELEDSGFFDVTEDSEDELEEVKTKIA